MENTEKMGNTELSPEKSLQLISSILQQNRQEISRNTGKPFLLWGCLSFLSSLIIWLLWSRTGNPAWNFLWFAMTLTGALLHWRLERKTEEGATTFLASAIGSVWILFGCISCSLAVINIFLPIPILLFIMLLMGFSTSLTGVLIKNSVLSCCGILSILLCIPLSAGRWLSGPDTLLAMALAALVGLVIPGIILYCKTVKKA